ncbi:hypothetical protein [Azospirillum argentinense]
MFCCGRRMTAAGDCCDLDGGFSPLPSGERAGEGVRMAVRPAIAHPPHP